MKPTFSHIASTVALALLTLCLTVTSAFARLEYGTATDTYCQTYNGTNPYKDAGYSCAFCHVGGIPPALNSIGQIYKNNGMQPAAEMCPVKNTAPVANAGPDQTVSLATIVALDGTKSSDVDGNPLTYHWSLTTPSGSGATLSSLTASKPTFKADKPGQYVAQLIVNDGTVNSLPDTVTISTGNTAPVANAGPDQTVAVGSTVTLNGTGSTDADGNALTYQWSFVSVPMGSTANFSNPTTAKPTFIADKVGQYVAQLIVNDGTANSLPDTVTITTTGMNTAPVANAGPDQSVTMGSTVTLNGGGSTDVDGNPLTYDWMFLSVPTGSTASFSNPTAAKPTFVADKAGQYVAQLIVNDGTANSLPDTVTITTAGMNTAPVGNAGPDQTVNAGATVQLDGSGSKDADGNPLSYQWALTSIPTGSKATLSNATAMMASFVADVAGQYVAQLSVNDGMTNSAPDTVTITTLGVGNATPTANAGPDQKVAVGTIVTLDASGSKDPDGAPLTYQWILIKKPLNSTATLSNPGAVQPTFKVDRKGEYIAQLIVSDGTLSSTPDTVLIKTSTMPYASGVYVQRAKWNTGAAKLMIIGRAPKNAQVAIRDAASGKTLITVTASDTGRFRAYFTPPFIPCAVIAVANSHLSEKTSVAGAPSNCGATGGAPVVPQEDEDEREDSEESVRR